MKGAGAEFVVRPGSETDIAAIYALECESFQADRLSRRALRRFLKASHRPVLVARSFGRVIGFVIVSLTPHAHSARIYSFAVEPAHRRRGVGRELLRAAERFARARGRTAMRLETRYDNAPAIALYRRLGFRDFGRYPGYYADGAEALRFEKPLAAE
jgi:ribosomal-protein-alanine acetyltransferase